MTHAELENPSDLIASAIATVINADSPAFGLTAYSHRHLGSMEANRVEISATGFRRESNHMDFSGETPFYNHRRGSILLTVVTARTDQQDTDLHAYAVGRLRYLLSRPAQKLTPAALSGLVVLELEDLGESPAEDETTDTDRTVLNFGIEYMIPAAVYGAVTG